MGWSAFNRGQICIVLLAPAKCYGLSVCLFACFFFFFASSTKSEDRIHISFSYQNSSYSKCFPDRAELSCDFSLTTMAKHAALA